MNGNLIFESFHQRILQHLVDKGEMIFFGSAHKPFARHGIAGFYFAAPFKFQVMFSETFFKTLHGLFIEITYNPVISHLVQLVNIFFHETENEQHGKDHRAGDHRNPFVTGTDAHAQGGSHPDHGGGGDSVHTEITFENDAGPDESDTRGNIGSNAVRIGYPSRSA